MTSVQDALATFTAWLAASSVSRTAPLGGMTGVGPYAILVPQALALAPTTPAPLHAEHLPLWLPETQAPSTLPPFPAFPDSMDNPPASQGHVTDRLQHLVWMAHGGREELDGIALLPLASPSEPLQRVLDRNAPGLDLATTPVLFLPMWILPFPDRTWAYGVLPRLPV